MKRQDIKDKICELSDSQEALDLAGEISDYFENKFNDISSTLDDFGIDNLEKASEAKDIADSAAKDLY